jgi:hypothetical protein
MGFQAPAPKHSASHGGLKEEKQSFVSSMKEQGKRGERNVEKEIERGEK